MHLPCICSLTFTGGSDTIQSYRRVAWQRGGWSTAQVQRP